MAIYLYMWKFFFKLSIFLDCGLPDVESGVFFNKKNSLFWQWKWIPQQTLVYNLSEKNSPVGATGTEFN